MISLRRLWCCGPSIDEFDAATEAMNPSDITTATAWWEIWRDLYTRGPDAGFDTPSPDILRLACRAWRRHPIANPNGTPTTEDTALRWWNTWHAIYRTQHRRLMAATAGHGTPSP